MSESYSVDGNDHDWFRECIYLIYFPIHLCVCIDNLKGMLIEIAKPAKF